MPAAVTQTSPTRRYDWREEIVGWMRSHEAHGAPLVARVDEIAQRLEIPEALVPGLVIAYGAHLCGERGVPPVDLARVMGGRWDEALGRGLLAQRGILRYRDSRVSLAGAIQRALDELPPATGFLVGSPRLVTLLGPVVVVSTDEPSAIAAHHLGRLGGAILVAQGTLEIGELLFEAKVYGAVPLLPLVALAQLAPDRASLASFRDPAILVARSESEVGDLGLPRL